MTQNSNPFDHLFDQINGLLAYVKEHAHNETGKEIPPDVEKRLQKLQADVTTFAKLSDDIVRLSGISSEELKLRLSGVSPDVPPAIQKTLEKGFEIKQEVMNMNDKLEKILQHVPYSERMLSATTEEPKEKILDDEAYAKKRKGKFKRFGSNKNWKPL